MLATLAPHEPDLAAEAEDRLWEFLRDRRLGGYKFRRQHPIPPWTAGFACFKARLVVETDDGQDPVRDRGLAACGWRVLRFRSSDILRQPERVARAILDALREPHADAVGRGA